MFELISAGKSASEGGGGNEGGGSDDGESPYPTL